MSVWDFVVLAALVLLVFSLKGEGVEKDLADSFFDVLGSCLLTIVLVVAVFALFIFL